MAFAVPWLHPMTLVATRHAPRRSLRSPALPRRERAQRPCLVQSREIHIPDNFDVAIHKCRNRADRVQRHGQLKSWIHVPAIYDPQAIRMLLVNLQVTITTRITESKDSALPRALCGSRGCLHFAEIRRAAMPAKLRLPIARKTS
jgi:hypothetical protein